jgi:NAD(P)-dependent dehydrogenase (short-subunit alcohol dehydrogenase family)
METIWSSLRTPGRVDDLERMFRINAFAFYIAIRAYCARPHLAPFCSCVVVNSDSIYHAGDQTGAYAASKAALRVLTASLADSCRTTNASVATLLLGPLADTAKRAHLAALAQKRAVTEEALTREYLRRSNPFLVIEQLIDLDACYESVRHMVALGKTANGMLCKLDGGSSGSLV